MTAYVRIVYDLSDELLRGAICDQLEEMKKVFELYTCCQRGMVSIVSNPIESWEAGLNRLPADVLFIVDVLLQAEQRRMAENLSYAIKALSGFENYSFQMLVRPSISQFHFTPK